MKYFFVMDPLEGVNAKKDTSFIFMVGAHRKGHEVFYVPNDGISLVEGKIFFEAERVVPRADNLQDPFERSELKRYAAEEADAVFIRTEPPFDVAYIQNTWLLDQLPPTIPVLNRASGVRSVSEKVWAMQFPELTPATLLSPRKDQLEAFLEKHGKIVLKPTDGFGGQGVFILNRGDTNTYALFETMTANYTRTCIAQAFVPDSANGDKRILLLDGEPLGAVLRLHGKHDHRNNFFAGGEPVATEITDADRSIIAALRPRLKELGLYFVGIDIMGERLIEVNVTSPTCIQEMNRLYNQQLEDEVIAFVEGLVAAARKG